VSNDDSSVFSDDLLDDSLSDEFLWRGRLTRENPNKKSDLEGRTAILPSSMWELHAPTSLRHEGN